MEYREIVNFLQEKGFTWLAEDIQLYIDKGKVGPKEYEDIYFAEKGARPTIRRGIGLSTTEYSEVEKTQIVLDWLLQYFVELPGIFSSIGNTLNTVTSIQKDAPTAKAFSFSIEGLELEPNLSPTNLDYIKTLFDKILENTESEKLKNDLKNNSWLK